MYMYAHILVLFNAHMTNNSPCVLNIREKEARVFICGDYAFLCVIHGLSGASGKYDITCTFTCTYKACKNSKTFSIPLKNNQAWYKLDQTFFVSS